MGHLDFAQSKIHTLESFNSLRHVWRFEGKKLVFTNGCFDIFHIGHLTYLAKARDLGQKLVVGLNSDDSVTRLKGPKRPIQSLAERALQLASLRFVDAVIPFEQDTPLELIKSIEPDVLVKGGDYTLTEIVGHELVLERGGEVKTIDLVPGKSTTATIERLNNNG